MLASPDILYPSALLYYFFPQYFHFTLFNVQSGLLVTLPSCSDPTWTEHVGIGSRLP